jgi:hypothetical protein
MEGTVPALWIHDLVAQNLTNPYGKVHRIDVDSTTNDLPYGIPGTNPWFGNEKNYIETIYAWGFRNPYRLSFDKEYFDSSTAPPENGHFPFWISSTAETLFEATYIVDEPGNYGGGVKEGSHCIDRFQPFVLPETVNCTTDDDCPQETVCGTGGFCTCSDTDAYGYTIKDPVIEYTNNAALTRPEAVALVEAGLIDPPLGRASLGGYMYRGSEIPWLVGKFVLGDFAADQIDGQILVATDPGDGSLPWPLERAFLFDAAESVKAGFMKTVAEDAFGELYAVTGGYDVEGQIDGRIFKIIAATVDETQPPTTSPGSDTESTAPTPSPNEDTSSATYHVAGLLSIFGAVSAFVSVIV